jgi:uncharacterized protein (TIGR02757 family)
LNSELLFDLLESNYKKYNTQSFIELDPISIPHRYSKRQDIEISALFAATLAWGQRVTIIRKSTELMELMYNSPYEFIIHHTENDLKPLLNFKHRTFNATDLLYFIHILRKAYSKYDSLETLFLPEDGAGHVGGGLERFHRFFVSDDHFPSRTGKHVSSPGKKSACKRLNMFLRWMVREDANGVDFGLWNSIRSAQLICPFDVHVEKVARKLGLVARKQSDWQTAVELTNSLKKFDMHDPVKYDFALFGMGLEEKY